MLADPIHMNKGKKVSYYIVLLCWWSLYVAIPFQHGIGSSGQSKLPVPMLGALRDFEGVHVGYSVCWQVEWNAHI